MPTVPVICFPFAGAGAGAYRRLREYPSDVLTICPVQLPGREERYGEPPYTDVVQAVDGLLPELLELAGDGGRVALFGHSLGAVLAHEAAHRLGGVEGVTLVRLFVSGSPGPWTGRETRATGLSDDAFLARVRDFAGYTHPALEHPELRTMLLPALRADVEMHENYRPSRDKRLDVPITSIRAADDELVSAEEAAQWTEATTGRCRVAQPPGSHMYLVDAPGALVTLLERDLSADGTGR
jgi:surfactin synthase thioesterase subunit